jgi:hypothetical protein
MAASVPQHPCPWCQGRDFIVVERVFLEITDYGRPFDAITCTTCGHTAFFSLDFAGVRGRPVRVESEPYR